MLKKAKEFTLNCLPFFSKYLPYIFITLAVTSFLLNLILKHLGYRIPFETPANVLTVVYGVTTGILTLIGLIAIYISVNIQHNLQKCKEITWKLEGFTPKIDSFDDLKNASKEIMHELKMYYNVLNRSGDHFNVRIIDLTQFTIISVTLIWLISVNLFILPNQSITEYLIVFFITLCCVIIMGKFSVVIGKMKDFENFGGLRPLHDFINHKGPFNLRRILLLSNLKASRKGLSIGFSIIDFDVSVTQITVNYENGKEKKFEFNKTRHSHILKESDKEFPPGLNIPNNSLSCLYSPNFFLKVFTAKLLARGRRNSVYQYHFQLPKLTLANEVKYIKEKNELFLTNECNKISIKFKLILFNENLESMGYEETGKNETMFVSQSYDLFYSDEKSCFEMGEIQMDSKSIMYAFSYSEYKENK